MDLLPSARLFAAPADAPGRALTPPGPTSWSYAKPCRRGLERSEPLGPKRKSIVSLFRPTRPFLIMEWRLNLSLGHNLLRAAYFFWERDTSTAARSIFATAIVGSDRGMRFALAVAITTLTIELASGSILSQPSVNNLSLESIHMLDALGGWAIAKDLSSGVSALVRTTDGGSRWNDVTPASSSGRKTSAFRISVLSSDAVWVMPYGLSEMSTEIFRTADAGRTWKGIIVPAPTVGAISFINPRDGWLLASLVSYTGHQDVDIYRSSDGGEAWLKVAGAAADNVSSGLPNVGTKKSITFLNSTMGWITGEVLTIDTLYLYVTRDGGRTWRQENLPLPSTLKPHWRAWPDPPRFFSPRDGIFPVIYEIRSNSNDLAGKAVAFHTTRDGGMTWTQTTPVVVDASNAVHHAVTDMNHAWVTSGGELRATSDGGRRWTTIKLNRLLSDVTQLDFVSPNIGWAIRNTFPYGGGIKTPPFLLKTLDGGHTWTPLVYEVLR